MNTYKICKTCGLEKALNYFAINNKAKSGRHDYCKDCGNKKITSTTEHALLVGYKKCNKCGIIKDISCFGKSQNNITTYCKICRSKRSCEYYYLNKEHCLDKRKKLRDFFPDRISEQKKKSYANNKVTYYAANKRRRDKKKLICDSCLSVKDIVLVRELFDNKCFNCGSKDNLSLDHNIPLHKGFSLCLGNCVLLCRSCNSSKWTKMPEDFYSSDKIIILNDLLLKQKMVEV